MKVMWLYIFALLFLKRNLFCDHKVVLGNSFTLEWFPGWKNVENLLFKDNKMATLGHLLPFLHHIIILRQVLLNQKSGLQTNRFTIL